jgi:hypothetical protein
MGKESAKLNLYEADYTAWVEQQAELLKQHRFDELDMSHLLEELEDLGGSERRALESQMERLLHQLLKWNYQPSMRSASWQGSIAEARLQITKIIRRNPSLKNYPADVLADAYKVGRIRAIAETELSEKQFSLDCLYEMDEILNESYWPGENIEYCIEVQ